MRAKHQPNDSAHYRAGNSLGRVLVDGEREEVVRPRVRQQHPNGSTGKVSLASYQSASNHL